MGKGDKKTRRGKIFQGSFGVRRPKKSGATVTEAIQAAKVKEPEVKVAKPAPAKKETKTKKTETPSRKHE